VVDQQTGIDGYRLDAIKHIETVWVEELRQRVNAEVDQTTGRFYMVGETFETGNRDVIRQYVGNDLLDGQFDFPLRGAIVEHVLRRSGTMFDLDNFLATNDGYYPGIMSTFIGNHDIARVIQTALDQPWGTWDNGGSSNWTNTPSLPMSRAPFERLALGFTFLMTTQGIPLIYYGDEIGMAGSGDPDNRRFMQWTGTTADQDWLREQVQLLGQIRKDNPALWRGIRSTVYVSNDVYAYRMTDGEDVVHVAFNRSDTPQPVEGLPPEATDLLTGEPFTGPTSMLPPRSALILAP
jgi:glycosidase